MCFCSLEKNHLSISVLTTLLPTKVRNVIVALGRFFSFGICWLMGWRLFVSALNEKMIGTHGMQLTSVPLYPFIMAIALGMVIIGFVSFVGRISKFGVGKKRVTNEWWQSFYYETLQAISKKFFVPIYVEPASMCLFNPPYMAKVTNYGDLNGNKSN
jgi:TRAP-type C4-dicarboxylate transport system permease small subunit